MVRSILPILLGLSVSARSATYHVGPTGDDSGPGLSPGAPWATLQYAADVAVAGDTVLVQPGEYQGFVAMDHSGTAAAPIVFSAPDGGVLISSPCAYNNLDGINVENVQWVVIEGFEVVGMPRTGIRSALSDHVVIRGNTCTANGKWGILTGFAEHCTIEYNTCSGSVIEHGIYFSNSADDPIIRFNHCFDNNANGIHMNGDLDAGGDGVISNASVHGNVIHGNGTAGGSGINCDGVQGARIFNNLLYDNHASGISLYRIDGGGPSINNKVYNNTIVQAVDGRWCVNITADCTGNQVLNNILLNQHPFRGSIVIDASALSGFQSDHNLLIGRMSPDGDATILDLPAWQALGFDLHAQIAAPQSQLFLDPGADHHALNSTAQQVDSGTDEVADVVTVDMDGQPRPQGAGFDIGCYELPLATRVTRPTRAPFLVRGIPGAIQVGDARRGDELRVHDLTGRVHFAGSVNAEEIVIPVPMTGVYLVQLVGASSEERSVMRVLVP